MFSGTVLVSEVAAQHQQAHTVLATLEIDLDSAGELDLASAALAQGIELAELLGQLNEAVFGRQVPDQPGRDWSQADSTELIEYICRRHHAHMRRHLPRIRELLEKAVSGNDLSNPTEMSMLHAVFAALKADMEQHMYLEEEIIFPLVVNMERHRKGLIPKPQVEETLGGLDPFAQMEQEHDEVDESLAEIRRLTEDLSCPDGACDTLRELYTAFGELEADLREHIKLENDYLWPVRPRAPR